MRIGIDFDNTIAGYDGLFPRVAVEMGLLAAGAATGKAAVKARLLQADGGERKWMRLQGRVYGAHMAGAEIVDGVPAFLRRCRTAGAEVFIVSHKTEFGHMDPERVNLRDAARRWMEGNGFFAADGFRLEPGNVFFEPTRAAKVARIAALGCSHFIDDLVAVFDEPGFPAHTARVLFDPQRRAAGRDGLRVAASWNEIGDAVFGDS